MADLTKHSGGEKPEAAKSLTASSASVASFAGLQQAFRDMPDNIPTAIILIAPNNTVAKQWRKDYPGVKVTTARRYYTSNVYAYPLPKDFVNSLKLPQQDTRSTQKPSKGKQKIATNHHRKERHERA